MDHEKNIGWSKSSTVKWLGHADAPQVFDLLVTKQINKRGLRPLNFLRNPTASRRNYEAGSPEVGLRVG